MNKGFTLVEMLVVLILMSILLGVAAMGIIAAQDQASQISADNNAESVFVTAQKKITQLNASGALEDKVNTLKNSEGKYPDTMQVPVYRTDLTFTYPNKFITKSMHTQFSESDSAMLLTSAEIWGDYNYHNILVLRSKSGDYDKYLNGETLDPATVLLFELIEDGISERDVLNCAIALEFAPDDAQVFSAFFSQAADSYDYLSGDSGTGGVVDIAKRSYSNRISKMLGYYGVENLTHIRPGNMEDKLLGALTYKNGDTLSYHLKFDSEMSGTIYSELNYTIAVYDAANHIPALVFKCSGKEIKEKNTDIMNNMISCALTRFDSKQNPVPMGMYELPVYWEKKDGKDGLGFILDAADASAAITLLEKKISGETTEAMSIRAGGIQEGEFSKTLSFFRFGTWADTSIANWTDQIYVEIEAEDNGLGNSNFDDLAEAKNTDPVSPMFEETAISSIDTSAKKCSKLVNISNPRHLYNMRYLEEFNLKTLGAASDEDTSKNYSFTTQFDIKKNLNWGEFADKNNAACAFYASSDNYNGNTAHKSNSAEFPSIRELRAGDSVNGYCGTASGSDPNLQNAYKITGIKVTKANNELYKLYDNYKTGQAHPAGMFIENKGTIRYLALDQCEVKGEDKVGSICGVNSGTLQYCGTLSTRVAAHQDPSIVAGIKYVGGVFGYSAKEGAVTYSNLSNAARVTGQEYVGGITGYLLKADKVEIYENIFKKVSSLTLSSCANSGQVRGLYGGTTSTYGMEEAERVKVRYIGGIVGYFYGNIIQDCSSCPVYESGFDNDIYNAFNAIKDLEHHDMITYDAAKLTALKKYASGWCVGGIAGAALTATVTGCETISGGIIMGDRFVGGIVGFNSSNITLSNNDSFVFGNDYVGGIAGIVSKADETAGYVNLSAVQDGNKKITKSVNSGRVFALYDYAGGVCGRCNGYLDVVVSQDPAKISGRNFVGASSGYFYGTKVNGSYTGAVDGENFVGGVSGYFRAGSTNMGGNFTGPVIAYGSFAGGIAGCASGGAFLTTGFTPACTELQGNYFVGALAGAVIFNPSGNEVKPAANVYLENLEIKATAYAGGALGYLALTLKDTDAVETIMNSMAGITTELGNEWLEVPAANRGVQAVTDMVSALDFGTTTGKVLYNNKSLYVKSISPRDKDLVYASGFIGANADNTILNFSYYYGINKVGAGSITATHIVKQLKVYDPSEYKMVTKEVKLAYSSKFVGKNNSLSTMTDCRGAGTYSSESDYRGGLCEINNGTIVYTNTNTIPSYTPYQTSDTNVDRLGGLCGINNGTIRVNMKNLYNAKISGRDIVGGVVGENYGEIILDPPDKAKDGDYKIYYCQVTTSGSIAGCICGRNVGTIKELYDDRNMKLDEGCYVTAKDCAGGFIGEQVGGMTLKGFNVKQNNASIGVEASEGIAGGVVGRVIQANVKDSNSDVVFDSCIFGNKVSVKGQVAGGIVGSVVLRGDKGVKIDNCSIVYNDNNVVKIKDYDTGAVVGGIVGTCKLDAGSSKLSITNCWIQAEVENSTEPEKSAGIIYDAGGATIIDNCRVYCPKAGHGITATEAYAITNCFDGSVKGREKFGSVVSGGILRNNYSVEKKDSSVTITDTEMPDDVTNVGIYALNSQQLSAVNYELYAVYEGEDHNIYRFYTTMKVKIDPEAMTCFFNDYKDGSGPSNWRDMDNKFEKYIEDHYYN